LCPVVVAAPAVAGIPVAVIGRVQCVVKFGLFDREPNLRFVVGRPDFEGLRKSQPALLPFSWIDRQKLDSNPLPGPEQTM